MFIRSLDEKELETEEFENMTGEKMDKIFPRPRWGNPCCWSKFKTAIPAIFITSSLAKFPTVKNMKQGHLPDFTK